MMLDENKEKLSQIVHPSSYDILKLQQSITVKIVTSISWINRYRLPDSIIYEISTFLFRCPIKFKTQVYSLSRSRIINVKKKYILKRLGNHSSQLSQKKQEKISLQTRSPEQSAFLTIMKEWKPISLSQNNYNQVLQRGKMFLFFLSNITLHPLNNTEIPIQYDPFTDKTKYQKQQKEQNKLHYLISDYREAAYKSFQEIWKYEKDKKISLQVIKSFINLMGSAFVIVRIDENYKSSRLGCEGKYIYFANNHKLPLHKNRKEGSEKGEALPWLEMDREIDQWKLGKGYSGGVSLYQQSITNSSRRKRYLLTEDMLQIRQDDVWIQQFS